MRKFYLILLTISVVFMQTDIIDAAIVPQDNIDVIAQEIILGERPQLSEEELGQLEKTVGNRVVGIFSGYHERYRKMFNQGRQDRLSGFEQNLPTDDFSKKAYIRGYDSESKPIINHDVQEPSKSETCPDDYPDYSCFIPNKAQKTFIKRISKNAQEVAQANDLYPSVLIAQAALESNWGTSDLSKNHHNLFGIKGDFAGQACQLPTVENINGKDVQVTSSFRHYQNEQESLADYVAVLNQPLYNAAHRKISPSYHEVLACLRGTYATDPQYDHKLEQIIQSANLTKYDEDIIPKPNLGSTKMKPTRSVGHKDKQEVAGGHHWSIPVIGGVSSVGMIELIRRLIK